MAGLTLAMLEEKKNAVVGELNLALKAARTPRVSLGSYTAGKRIPLLGNIRQLLRIDLSAIDLPAAEPFRQSSEQIRLLFLKGVLTYYRELAAKLDRLLQIKDPLQRKRIRDLVGTRDAIESVLEALEDKIEDLEIATSPEVHTAIKQLIDEAKSP
jgi:hypothetical protein